MYVDRPRYSFSRREDVIVDDEAMAHLISDYKNFGLQLKDFAERVISKSNNSQLQTELQNILNVYTKDSTHKNRRYEDLLKGQFKLTNVYRVELKNDANDISVKIADFTKETITQLIAKGECDASEIFN